MQRHEVVSGYLSSSPRSASHWLCDLRKALFLPQPVSQSVRWIRGSLRRLPAKTVIPAQCQHSLQHVSPG